MKKERKGSFFTCRRGKRLSEKGGEQQMNTHSSTKGVIRILFSLVRTGRTPVR